MQPLEPDLGPSNSAARNRHRTGVTLESVPPEGLVAKCSFCGKSQDRVRLIAGPKDIYVCNECVDLCNQMLSNQPEARPESRQTATRTILIVTGPPGAGKTTVARLVATELGDKSVLIEADWFWTTIVKGYIAPWKPSSKRQNLAVIRAVGASAGALVRGGYPVVIEGIVGPWFLPQLVDELGNAQNDINYVVLRPPLDVALDRATSRGDEERVAGHPPLADPEPVRHMWQRFSDLGVHERFVVDNQGVAAEDAARIVLERLRAGTLRLELVDNAQRTDVSKPN